MQEQQQRQKVLALAGNYAVAYAVKQAKPTVLAVYPITPQTTMLEQLADYVNSGELKAEMIKVESEHSAMSSIFGAALAGSRVFTATASQGLLYMGEMIYWVGGAKVPLVAAVATRSIGAPWSIWDDHQDIMSKRDSIWIQMMAENVQEAYDLTILAFRISEHKSIEMPVMVGFDGFILTHTIEKLEVLDDESVQAFLPPRSFNMIDFSKPVGIGTVAGPSTYMNYRHAQMKAMEGSKAHIIEIMQEYSKLTGRHYDMVENYKCDDADYVIVAMGAWSGDAKDAVDVLRSKGIKAGMLKITVFRPFPSEQVKSILSGKNIVVFDRSYSYGLGGMLATEVKSVLFSTNTKVASVIAGLGGKDVTPEDFEDAVSRISSGNFESERWLV
ncbi:MAG: pyruvate ferredoxin oxidoreductase [Candidatus Micrarchaeia archaeon]